MGRGDPFLFFCENVTNFVDYFTSNHLQMTKRYQLVNNIGGWLVFVIALVTYWLTLEPTASYWDCGEFIIQADKLEVGHPPGNPIFMLTARFFANFAPDITKISVMVNAMSGLLSALTILLLFFTISHLVRRLLLHDNNGEPTLPQYIAIMGSALVGSLAYCWSDTFWFSAVEGEVYAFSSFCTALVFWLILKWENHADEPHSDRWLILIAYIIGVSVAVHLLNLLCIPAIVLVFAYRKWKDMNLVKSLIALLVSFAIIVLVLFGLVPGFIKVAQWTELLCVNTLGMDFNSGAIIYGVVMTLSFVWSLYELRVQRSALRIRVSFMLSVFLSGMLFFGSGIVIGLILLIGLWVWMRWGCKAGLPVRVLSIVMWSMGVIFVGYSSYALILIRSAADTPMNQNSPDNVFDLASYLNREQYGENPLLYGETMYSSGQRTVNGTRLDTIHVYDDGTPLTISTPIYGPQIVKPGHAIYAKGVRGSEPKSEYQFLTEGDRAKNQKLEARGGDYYVKRDYKPELKLNPELNMLFPRLYSRQHASLYREWVNLDTMPGQLKTLSAVDAMTGEKVTELDIQGEPLFNEVTGTLSWPEKTAYKPTVLQNLAYFFNYQLNHMYMRYFLWNFAGRQNDLLNQHGELDAGNWISGIPAIDNQRLGDQSLLPKEMGSENRGNNKYYMLPLILGLIGLLWQSFAGKRGIEQFWVVFFLFFMTGIAIVLYLNQTPNQPRERDYAFAGSFYAYAIWIGMGVAALWQIALYLINRRNAGRGEKATSGAAAAEEKPAAKAADDAKTSLTVAVIAAILGLAVPLQMVSQTWDDHDRSGRYAARDFAVNYLESLEPNAIVFCNGDNDTFPLWYAQEVEGVRPDVRIINLSYLNSDWYANQHRMQSYSAAPVSFTATPADIAYGVNDVTLVDPANREPADLRQSLKLLYSGKSVDSDFGYRKLPSSVVRIPVDKEAVKARGLVAPGDSIEDFITIDLASVPALRQKGYLSLGEILMLDIIATNAAEGWKRPIYWATTVGDDYHLGLGPYLRGVGMNLQIVPTVQNDKNSRTDIGPGVIAKYRWGGADAEGKKPYFDETVRRMVYSTRSTMLDLASQFVLEGRQLQSKGEKKEAAAKYREAVRLVRQCFAKLPVSATPYELSSALTAGEVMCEASEALGDHKAKMEGLGILRYALERDAEFLKYGVNMRMNFINPSMTYESAAISYQYWRIIELFLKYGGSRKTVEDILRPTGMTMETLRSAYERAYGMTDGEYDPEDAYDPELLAKDVEMIAGVVNELAAMTPEEYAKCSATELQYDSMFQSVIDIFEEEAAGQVTTDMPEYKKVDRARTRRLHDAYVKNHPELTQ